MNQQNKAGFISCPNCGNDIKLPFNILNFYISLYKIRNSPTINIHRNFTLNDTNRHNINQLCKNSLRNIPFISHIILTKPYHNAFNEMARLGMLEKETIDEYLNKNIDLILF